MIKPKRGYPRPAHLVSKEVPVRYCENPSCKAKLSREKARKGYKYCDVPCRREHERVQALERRPKDLQCASCQRPLDPMRVTPSAWAKSEMHFCDEICAVAYHQKTGQYGEMSQKGNAKAKEYREKHGQVAGYEDRSKAVSKNNKKRPPKAKYFTREGRVWGYDVRFYPSENENEYRISIPELPEIEGLTASTKKAGLKLVRERILELRAEEAKGEIDARN
jgi:hypothetical protein